MAEDVPAVHDATQTTDRPRPGRITVEESFLDLIDQIACGDLETWRRIYASALADSAVRHAVVRAAGMVDPDFANAGALWRTLIERMPPAQIRHAARATPASAKAGAARRRGR